MIIQHSRPPLPWLPLELSPQATDEVDFSRPLRNLIFVRLPLDFSSAFY